MTAAGLIILLCLILIILFSSREWAAAAVVASVLYLPLGLHANIGGINFFAERFIEIAGFVRIVSKRELRDIQLNEIDKGLMLFQIVYLFISTVFILLNPDTDETWIGRFSFFCDGVLSYFIFRALISEPRVFKKLLRICAYLIVPFAASMLIESMTGKNLFTSLGATLPDEPNMRGGGFRAQGSFGVSITAGCFGATLLPLFVAAILIEKKRFWGLTGIAASLLIVVQSRSGTPLLSLAAAVFGWLCWKMRSQMKFVRWGVVLSLIFFTLMMTQPVWVIFGRLGDITGGHGLDRAADIENFVSHFGNWWLMGMSSENMSGWDVARLPNGSIDMLNEYASIGIGGGMISLVLFIRLILKCFKGLGTTMQSVRKQGADHIRDDLLLWGIGCSLFSHVIAISGVIYWDQMYVIWYMALALVASLTGYFLQEPIPARAGLDSEMPDTLLTSA